MLRFYTLRILRDYIGHAILIGLPMFLVGILTYINTPDGEQMDVVARHIGIVFLLMFQMFGAAYTFEGLRDDFLTPRKDRIKATPVNPMTIVLTQIGLSTIITFLQGMVLIGFTMVVFNAVYPNLPFILLLVILSALFAQLFGALLVFTLKSASKAQIGVIAYAIIAPIMAGLNVELPDHAIVPYLERYSSPLALVNTGIQGAFESHTNDMMIGLVAILTFITIFILLVKHFSKRVIV